MHRAVSLRRAFLRSRGRVLAVLFAIVTGTASAGDLAATPGVTVEGTAFVLQRPGQRPLKGAELRGMVLNIEIGGRVEAVRLARISPDPDDAEILRHEFERQDESGQWHSACEPNFEGETWGIPVGPGAGQASHTGAISLTCSSGAIAKCIRYGYKPWGRGHNGENLAPYFAACVRMIRADYAGDGSPHTKPGTFIKFRRGRALAAGPGAGDGLRFRGRLVARGRGVRGACPLARVRHPRDDPGQQPRPRAKVGDVHRGVRESERRVDLQRIADLTAGGPVRELREPGKTDVSTTVAVKVGLHASSGSCRGRAPSTGSS